MERERERVGGGGNECTVGLTVVNLMTFSSYQRKIRTLYLFYPYSLLSYPIKMHIK